MAILAHPDDESLGCGSILARYAAEGVECHLVTATRGERGRHGEGDRPSDREVGERREAEVRAAGAILGITDVRFLDYLDAELDQADPVEVIGRIAGHIRRVRPHVVVTFGFEGAYGHPDHIAICQFTTAAVTAAADASFTDPEGRPAHRVSKLYWMAWDHDELARYQLAFKRLVSRVDGVEREAAPWPSWAITTRVDTREYWPVVWEAIQCHRTQLPGYGGLASLSDADQERLWGLPGLYRVASTVGGGREMETDLFEGLREDGRGGRDHGAHPSTSRPVDGGAAGPSGAAVTPSGLRESRSGPSVPLHIDPGAFRDMGHALVDRIAEHLQTLPDRPVTGGLTPDEARSVVGAAAALPENGADPAAILEDAASLLFRHSLFNAHPRFMAYVTAPAAPLGILGDMLASAVNPNGGAWVLSPIATEMESQAVRWIAELIGYPTDAGGILVSGGNMANFVGFFAARARAGADWEVRRVGHAAAGAPRLRAYVSKETHTWVQKAADLSGLGTDAVRWVATDDELRMDMDSLRSALAEDRGEGFTPFIVVGTAGSVSTGAVDPLGDIARLCADEGLWFHVDGAYGGFAAVAPGVPADMAAMALADSVAVDPHKWLYTPLEAGCALVRDPEHMRNAFSYHPPYYYFGQEATNYVDFGMQNSRGFRALKVWMQLKHAGRSGYERMIGDDIRLAEHLHRLVTDDPRFEAVARGLSISTFRFVPEELRASVGGEATEDYLNRLNQDIQGRLERGGELFISNAVVRGKYLLRACIVNYNTTLSDVEAVPDIVARVGAEAHAGLGGP